MKKEIKKEKKEEDPIKKHFSELGKKSWEKRKTSLLQVKKLN